jgi:hypothetical protein
LAPVLSANSLILIPVVTLFNFKFSTNRPPY